MKVAEDAKKKAFADWRAAREEGKPASEIQDKRKAHVEAVKDHKTKLAACQRRDKKIAPKLTEIVDDVNAYLKHSRGKYEGLLEKIISSPPIKAKHNPFYNGSFNGNDCFRLLENVDLTFEQLTKAADDEENEDVKKELLALLKVHKRIFASFAALVPSFRTTKRLSLLQQKQLKDDIQEFWEAYLAGPGSITIKIHMLVFHALIFLDEYGTIGFWTEDAVESIHAIVNTLARRYAALDLGRRAHQVLRMLTARKQKKDVDLKAKVEKEDEDGFRKKRSRVQGSRVNQPVADEPNQDIVNAADEFLALVQQAADGEINGNASWDTGGPGFPQVNLVDCQECRNSMQDDDVKFLTSSFACTIFCATKMPA